MIGTDAECAFNALVIDNDENVGKVIKFKVPPDKGLHSGEIRICEIIGCQRAWGHDENGKYTMLDSYRLSDVKDRLFEYITTMWDFELKY